MKRAITKPGLCVLALVAALGLQACDNVQRSMVFMTGTMIGVDAAVQPQGDSPVHITIGYKRAEVLFDPIMEDCDCLLDMQKADKQAAQGDQTAKPQPVVSADLSGRVAPAVYRAADAAGHNSEATGPNGDKGGVNATTDHGATPETTRYKIKDQAHSVLAKLLGDTNVSAKSGSGPEGAVKASVSQWFASGRAAEILAQNGGAAALTDDPGVASAVAGASKGFGAGLKAEERGILPQVIDAVYQALSALGQKGDAEAARLAKDLDTLADDLSLPYAYPFTKYKREETTVTVDTPVPADGRVTHDRSGVTAYSGRLRASVEALDALLRIQSADPTLLTPPPNKTFADLRSEHAQQVALLRDFEERVSRNERLRRAAAYLQGKLSGEGSATLKK